jgi:hypothetical protein
VAKPGAQHMHRAQRICRGFQPTMTPMTPILQWNATRKTHGNASRCFKQHQHVHIGMQ